MENLFGKYEDNGKEKTMSFRVSKETQRIFDIHAKKFYGDRGEGLKKIFLDYMSQYAFKRQSLTYLYGVYIPKKEKQIKYKNDILCYRDEGGGNFLSNLDDIKNVIVDKGIWELKHYAESTAYYEDNPKGDLEKYYWDCEDIDLDDFIYIKFELNNQLDEAADGIYSIAPEKDAANIHQGLIIVPYLDDVYYVTFSFSVESGYVSSPTFCLISNSEAYSEAIRCDNLDLAKMIDAFNDGTSNIEKNKEFLKEKRESLIQQIKEIDNLLSQFED